MHVWTTHVDYLSLILLEGHVEMDPIKVAGICDWLTLTSMIEVQSFIRCVNLYQQFIQHFLHVAKPLHQLTKKGEAWRYTEAEKGWHPVGFMSKSLSDTERNYEIHDKEHLSIIQGLEEWKHILEGTQNTIEILDNHRNLTYFWTSQN